MAMLREREEAADTIEALLAALSRAESVCDKAMACMSRWQSGKHFDPSGPEAAIQGELYDIVRPGARAATKKLHSLPEYSSGCATDNGNRAGAATPEEFKAEYRRKGWTGKELAKRWDKSPEWISKIGNDPERDLHWDDAVRGLPSTKETERMTPEEFKAECRRKGWNGRKLATRWKKSIAWISRVGNDPERAPHWDDAVRGLPSNDTPRPA